MALGEVVPEEPVPFRVDGGQVVVDPIGNTMVNPYVVSPRFVRCLSDHGFTGWSTFRCGSPLARRSVWRVTAVCP